MASLRSKRRRVARRYVRLDRPEFKEGDFVKWIDVRGTMRESCVLENDDGCFKVVSHTQIVNILSASEIDTLPLSRWRSRLKVGQIVGYYTLASWHPCLVREILPADDDHGKRCVIEPALLGYTKTVSLCSLRLSRHNEF